MSYLLTAPDEFSRKLCEIFNLNPTEVVSLTIEVSPEEVVRIKATMVVREDQAIPILDTFKALIEHQEFIDDRILDHIAVRLATLRRRLGMSLRDVQKETKISISTISRIENGQEAHLSNILKLWLFYDTKKNHPA